MKHETEFQGTCQGMVLSHEGWGRDGFLLIWILTPWFKSKHEERFHPPSTWVGVYMYILHILQTKSPIPSGEWPHLQYTVYSYVWTCVHIHCWTCFCAYYLFRGPAVPMDHHSWAAAMRPIFSSKLTRRLHTCRNLCPHSDIDTVQLIVLNRSEGSNICKSRCILHPRWKQCLPVETNRHHPVISEPFPTIVLGLAYSEKK